MYNPQENISSRYLSRKQSPRRTVPTFNGIPLQPYNQVLPESRQAGAIYIGDIDAASNKKLLKELNIEAVLTVAAQAGLRYSLKKDQIRQMVVEAIDQDYYDLMQHFDQTFRFIENSRRFTNVMVHCMAGVSRSTSIVIAYLMRKYGWSASQAYSTVKSKRRLTCPNMGFCQQIKSFENALNRQQKGVEGSTEQSSSQSYRQSASSSKYAYFKNQYAYEQYPPQRNRSVRSSQRLSTSRELYSSQYNSDMTRLYKYPETAEDSSKFRKPSYNKSFIANQGRTNRHIRNYKAYDYANYNRPIRTDLQRRSRYRSEESMRNSYVQSPRTYGGFEGRNSNNRRS